MQTSPQGRQAIALFEGVRLRAYRDAVGVWTIGIGHTAAAGDPKPAAGMTITAERADAILASDLARIYEPAVLRHVTVPLLQREFDALVSFTFNLGEGNLARSSLLRKLNAGDRTGAAGAFGSWTKAGGRVLAGLVHRREAESILFARGLYPGVEPGRASTGRAIAQRITLGRGMRGEAVKDLQTRLLALGLDPGPPDGDFGLRTVAAVKTFQARHGLAEDGVAGLKTQAALCVALGSLET